MIHRRIAPAGQVRPGGVGCHVTVLRRSFNRAKKCLAALRDKLTEKPLVDEDDEVSRNWRVSSAMNASESDIA
jgi:hypothetical protein